MSGGFLNPQATRAWCKNLALKKRRAAHGVNFTQDWKRELCASQETLCVPHCLGVNARERKIEGNGP